ncbi:MAG TPA: PEP-CTERM sorting domain-containing protein [Bryobacteraceae bacterium]
MAATRDPQGKNSQTFTFSGLPAGQSFTLFLYAYNVLLYPHDNYGDEVFTVNGSSFDTANGTPSSEAHNAAVTGMLTGVTSSTGTIEGTWAMGPFNGEPGGEIDWSGFQLAVSAVPEPSSLFLLALGVLPLLLLLRRRAGSTKS